MIIYQGVERVCIINVSTRRACGQLHVPAASPLPLRG
jgi:hypothetical protein